MNESEFNKIAIIKISGMTCEGCTMNVQRALTSVEGVKDVKVNLEKKRATIKYNDAKVSQNKLKKTIVETGFIVDEDFQGEKS